MYLSKIRVKNYKSFEDSGEIEFKPGINIIVGQNNSGKTALLEVLELKFSNIAHKSEKSLPKQGQKLINFSSEAEVTFTIEPEELKLLRVSDGFSEIFIRKPINDTAEIPEKFVNDFNNCFDKGLSLTVPIPSRQGSPKYTALKYSFYEANVAIKQTQKFRYIKLRLSEDGKYVFSERVGNLPEKKYPLGQILVGTFRKKIYRFEAERVSLGSCDAGFSRELIPNCQNLAEVLQNTHNHNSWLYEKFNEYVSQIYPAIKWVSAIRKTTTDKEGNEKQIQEISIWNVDRKTEREDLTIALSQCGTGIGQVLAILYLIVTSKEPRLIIIDEPNSFLHPGAAKKLIQILNKFPEHQYFISTHSPEILTAAKPSTITRLKYVAGETIAESINLDQTKDLKETLIEIGVKFSDVFFAENILWVEGPTEAEAFPLILQKENELFDVTFLPLVNTGDLREKKQARKHAKLAFEIYKRLSGAYALAPPFVGVVFDKEAENEQEIKELKKISKGKAKFIQRRMFENYLLDAEAIAEVYNSEPDFGENKKITIKEVEEKLLEKRAVKKYLPDEFHTGKTIRSKTWLENVDGANLLADLFSQFSGKTIEYRKTTHSIKLTEWLLENKPKQLAELKDFLVKLISD